MTVTETEPDTAKLLAEVDNLEFKLETLSESYAELELMADDRGWLRLSAEYAKEFSREGLRKNAELCRITTVANPLIKRGAAVRAGYVFGQGITINARANGESRNQQDVNKVVQEFWDDERNRDTIGSLQALVQLENLHYTDGNIFFVLFTKPLTGKVQVRTMDFDEIADIITNPNDRTEAWFYRREWTEDVLDFKTGRTTPERRVTYYPAIGYRPAVRVQKIGGHEVRWDSPIYHAKVNAPTEGKFGVGDAYAALPYARAYKEFIEDWTKLIKALSRIAYRYKTDKKQNAQKARADLEQLQKHGPAGSTVAQSGNGEIEAVPKTGATIDAESGRPLLALVAAGLGLPVTVLSSDPGTTGARAVAETLNFPTRLEFQTRQELWREHIRKITNYVIDQSVKAPRGELRGTVERNGNNIDVVLAGDTDRTLEIDFPDLDELPLETLMEAISKADSLGKLPPLVIAKLALRALKYEDIDDALDELMDDQGNFIDPMTTAGDAATRAYRNGENPAAAMRGNRGTNRDDQANDPDGEDSQDEG